MLNQSGVFKWWAGVLEMQQYQRFDRMKKARWAAGLGLPKNQNAEMDQLPLT
jgi:hypothetical protein